MKNNANFVNGITISRYAAYMQIRKCIQIRWHYFQQYKSTIPVFGVIVALVYSIYYSLSIFSSAANSFSGDHAFPTFF